MGCGGDGRISRRDSVINACRSCADCHLCGVIAGIGRRISAETGLALIILDSVGVRESGRVVARAENRTVRVAVKGRIGSGDAERQTIGDVTAVGASRGYLVCIIACACGVVEGVGVEC